MRFHYKLYIILYNMNNSYMHLEHRLREYIDKKKYYHDNNITVPNIEKSYNITKSDLNRIKAYMNGQTDSHTNDMVDISKSRFPSDIQGLHQDPRLLKMKQKQQRH